MSNYPQSRRISSDAANKFTLTVISTCFDTLTNLQGNLALKDFDIRKAAEGVQLRAVEREFNALVSENYLEIHLFWAGKGTCCVPSQGTYGPSISAISVTPGNILNNDINEYHKDAIVKSNRFFMS